MPDDKYCYPNSDVLINKLGIKDSVKLFMAEKEETSLRLFELQKNPIKGKKDEPLYLQGEDVFMCMLAGARIRNLMVGDLVLERC